VTQKTVRKKCALSDMASSPTSYEVASCICTRPYSVEGSLEGVSAAARALLNCRGNRVAPTVFLLGRVQNRGLHSSTFELNLGRSFHCRTDTSQRVPQKVLKLS
jgi:hypothetical protein